jgi:hypothetical protein
MPLNEIKNEFQIAGNGHNELYDASNPVKYTRLANNVVKSHVPENGGTWQFDYCPSRRLHRKGLNENFLGDVNLL